MDSKIRVCACIGDELGHYAFGNNHPFGPKRLPAFVHEAENRGLLKQLHLCGPERASDLQIGRFHTREYIEHVKACSERGSGFLDYGDTPVFPGVYEAAAMVAGTVLDAIRRIMLGECRRGFVPIAGLHHARRGQAAGFCAFNDCGIAIEALLSEHGVKRVAYVDIDAHHGDGVFYAFEKYPGVIIADVHEDGHYLYPGTGFAAETGKGKAKGTKLNLPMQPAAKDADFFEAWEKVAEFIHGFSPEFILFQCGADCLTGDPITHLNFSAGAHRHAASRLCALAEDVCGGRILAMGGGGYVLDNLAAAWCAVVEAFLETPAQS